MKNFLKREISEEASFVDNEGALVKITAWRSRTSYGNHTIGVEFCNQRIDFDCGDDPEAQARMLIDVLTNVCDDPCELPMEQS